MPRRYPAVNHGVAWLSIGLISVATCSIGRAGEAPAGAQKTGPQKTEPGKANPKDVSQRAAVLRLGKDIAVGTSDAAERYRVPKADDVQQLVRFLKKVRGFQPNDRLEFVEHARRGPKALQAAAERIIRLEKNEDSAAFKLARGTLLDLSIPRLVRGERAEVKRIIEEIDRHLKSHPAIGDAELELAMKAGRTVESSTNADLAPWAYERFGSTLAASKLEAIRTNGELLLGSARRLKLLNNVMQVRGSTLENDKFDLAQLKGKVVLVDFWATWCQACITEYPELLELYRQYHSQGFEIVGISLDQQREALSKYVKRRKVPWTVLFDENEPGHHPVADNYGVLSLPTQILINRDGNVISLKARGRQLRKLLKEEFSAESNSASKQPSPTDGSAARK